MTFTDSGQVALGRIDDEGQARDLSGARAAQHRQHAEGSAAPQ
ncbi:hypothetical protein [Streptomyces cylindrosporus]|nr:hypothetical protein [Streptomyces cylindrosporus]